MKRTLATVFLFFTISLTIAQSSQPYQVQVTGKGKQSIIFLPGYSCSADVWKETIAKFSSGYACHTFTFAGFAGVAPQANASMNEWAKSISAYIAAQKLEKPILIGHSLGGVLAMMIAADNPVKIGKLVVVDALPCLSAIYNPNFKSQATPDCMQLVDQFTKMDAAAFKTNQYQTIRMLVADTSKIEMITQWGIRSDRATLGNMYCDFSNTDLRDRISAIQCPTLILLETNFKNYDSAMKEQYKNLKTAQITYSNKGLHFIMYDDMEWYMGQLQAFIK